VVTFRLSVVTESEMTSKLVVYRYGLATDHSSTFVSVSKAILKVCSPSAVMADVAEVLVATGVPSWSSKVTFTDTLAVAAIAAAAAVAAVAATVVEMPEEVTVASA
jgi:hypothetical protein